MGKTQTKGRSGEQSLMPFLDPLQAVQDLLDAFGERGVIVGGIAVSLLGRPRFTADVEAVFLLEMEELPHLLEEAAARGIEARIADVETFARQNRVILLRHTASGIDIDISLGILPSGSPIEMIHYEHAHPGGGSRYNRGINHLALLPQVCRRPVGAPRSEEREEGFKCLHDT